MQTSSNSQKSVAALILILGCAAIYSLQNTSLEWAVWLYPLWIATLVPFLFQRYGNMIGMLAIRFGIPIVVSLFIWAAFRYVSQSQFLNAYARQLYQDWDTITVALSIFSTLHAITFAFCLWKAMQDFDDHKNTLHDEANQILSISSLLRFFDNVQLADTQKNLAKIRTDLSIYVSNMINNAQTDIQNENSKILGDCIDYVEYLEVKHDNDRIALEGIVKGFSKLIMIRSHRISCLSNNMSPFLFLIIAIMSAAIIAMFFVRNPTGFNSNEFIIPLISFVYTFLLVMLIDLDRPFDGYWKVSVEAFESIDLKFRKNIQKNANQNKTPQTFV
ncbi:MAG: DUF4239 domain-containing protein [Rhizobiaceae bacterium]|nr:DUF4239 domain-containing protein [Rhizobiaceae bacterium]